MIIPIVLGPFLNSIDSSIKVNYENHKTFDVNNKELF